MPVKGTTVCLNHGGKSPQVQRAAQRRLEAAAAALAVQTYGLSREVDPQQALLEEVHRTAGHVSWLGTLIAGLDQNELTQSSLMGGEKPAVWLELYQAERAHYARVAKAAIEAGVEERRVQLAEAQGEALGQVIRSIVGDILALFSAAGVPSEIVRRMQREEIPTVVRARLMEQAELGS